MIDFEKDIFDACARAVLAEYPEAVTSSVNINAPADFPAVSIVEADSRNDVSVSRGSGREVAAVVAYDVNVYSDKRRGARDEAKQIFSVVDDFFGTHNFTRTFRTQGQLNSSSSVYRVYARFVAGIDENGKIYRRQ